MRIKRRSASFNEGYRNPYTNVRQKKAFDDACDCIHQGYGKMYWKKNFRNGLDLSQLDDVWEKAYDYMNESLNENKNLKEAYGSRAIIKVTTERDMDVDDIRNMVWSGAKDTLEDLDDDQLNTIIQIIAEENPDGIDETALNDILWFEREWIADILGFSSYDELMHGSSFDTSSLYVEEFDDDTYYITDKNTNNSLWNSDSRQYVTFKTKEEAQDYLDNHIDEFTEDDFS